jgi:hypothetical protein
VFQDRGELAFLVGTVDIDLQRRTPNLLHGKDPDLFFNRILPANYNTGGLTYFDLNTLHSAIVHHFVCTQYFTCVTTPQHLEKQIAWKLKHPSLPKHPKL